MTDSLTPKQELFAQKYIETGVASEAYRQAYATENMMAKTVWEEASRLLADPKVSARVNELKALHLKKHEVTIDRVVREYAKLAFLDIRKAFDEHGNLKPIHDLDDDTAAAISGLEVEVKRTTESPDEELEPQPHGGGLRRQHATTARLHKIKLSDKKGALDSLAKHLGMFVEKHEITGKDGQPIQVEDRTPLESARRVAFLLAQAAQKPPE